MTNRSWFILIVGIGLLASGLFALCFPVFLSSYDRWGIQIKCGTGYRTICEADIADSGDVGSSAPTPSAALTVPGEAYRAQCEHALAVRRAWAIPVFGVGGIVFAAIAAGLVVWALSSELSSARPRAGPPSLRGEFFALWLTCTSGRGRGHPSQPIRRRPHPFVLTNDLRGESSGPGVSRRDRWPTDARRVGACPGRRR